MPDGDEIAGQHQRARRAPATTTSSSPRATGTRPTTARSPSRAGSGPCTASQGTPGAELHPALDRDADRRDRRQGPGPGHRGLLGVRGHRARRARCASAASTQVTVVGLATDYCVKNTALDALREGFAVTVDTHRGIRGVDVRARRLRARPRRAARRRVRPWRKSPPSDDPRDRLLERLRRHIADERVLEAMRAVPRDRFVPAAPAPPRRGTTSPLPIGSGQTISQPLVVARMCELLELRGDERVLDVGTGSGYHAALLGAARARTCGRIERHAGAVASGRRRNLARRGRRRTSRSGRRRRARPARRTRPTTRSTSPRRRRRHPAGAGRPARARRAAGRRRSTTATSGSSSLRRTAGGRSSAPASSACASCRCQSLGS